MAISQQTIMDVLRTIPDPEMPISIVDLGLVENVRVQNGSGEGASVDRTRVEVTMLPTFVGCPALDMIASDVRAKVGALPGVSDVKVSWVFDPPWCVDRITIHGRDSLKAHGVTVPEHGSHLQVPGHDSPQTVTLRISAVPCPFCGSSSTYLDSAFGPTRCRTIYYCEKCRNSFEHLKRVGIATTDKRG
jgi:ring-1,2-phenylacetyl-CoA epoxidase subunit PaaD